MCATTTQRTLRIAHRLDREYLPAVIVTEGRKCDAYCVVATAGSVRWSNRADVSRSYTVTCSGQTPVACTCDGWKYRHTCKHTAATRKLIELGELAVPAADDRPAGWCVATEVE